MKEIKILRENITTGVNTMLLMEKSRALALAITKAQEAGMWLGKVLKESGQPNPYPESNNPNSAVIEKRTDAPEDDLGEIFKTEGFLDRTSQIKYLRGYFGKIESAVQMKSDGPIEHARMAVYYNRSSYALELSVMWLGMVLNEIANEGRVVTSPPEGTKLKDAAVSDGNVNGRMHVMDMSESENPNAKLDANEVSGAGKTSQLKDQSDTAGEVDGASKVPAEVVPTANGATKPEAGSPNI